MPLSRLLQLLRYIAIPLILGMCLLCMILAMGAYLLTPEGLNPAEAVVLRAYLLRHDSELNTPRGTDRTQRFFNAMHAMNALIRSFAPGRFSSARV